MSDLITRRRMLAGAALATPALVIGCDRLGAAPSFRQSVLKTGEWLSYRAHRLIGSDALAREYDPSRMSPDFRTNGNTRPRDDTWRAHAENGFADWTLQLTGMFDTPEPLSLDQLRAMPARSQITRHDCVEGWSAIGKWTGVPLGAVLDRAGLQADARYIVFECADDFGGRPYYESIDLVDAFHPQTILAYGMNDGDLPTGHGAPVRVRIERQLGYKSAKFIMNISAVASLSDIGRGQGGFWEDAGFYEWYAGI